MESKHKGKCKDMGVYKTTNSAAMLENLIVVFCELVGLVRMWLFLLMAEQTRIGDRCHLRDPNV